MGKETVLFRNEEKMSVTEAAGILRTIADKLETGKVKLSRDNKQVVLDIPNRVELEIKAEKEESKRNIKKKLEVEIEWVVGGKNAAGPMQID